MGSTKGSCPVIGLLGGIAAGKTTVARMLGDLGAAVICADEIGHAVLAAPAVRERIVARWGDGVVGADGSVDRAKLAQRAFSSRDELAALEGITHPAILADLRRQIAQARSAGAAAVVVDAPLLVETALDALCDALVFVDCPRAVRLARAAARGWDAAELARREALQTSPEAKRARARFTIDGSLSPETTTRQVQELWQGILGR